MWETIKKHPIISGAVVIVIVLLLRARSTAASSTDPNYSSGTTIVGAPSPLGGIQTAPVGGGAASSLDTAAFFQSQIEQAKSAQYAAQTAAMSGSNLDVLKSLLKTVGKGQDASFTYDATGQLSGIDVKDNTKPTNPVASVKEQIKIWNAKVKANLAAKKAGVTLPYPDIGFTTPPAQTAGGAVKRTGGPAATVA